MCVLGSCFKQLPPVAQDKEVYELAKESRDELAMLSCLYPLMFTHLDATFGRELICTDASNRYIGAASASVAENLHRELWRIRERRGWSTHMVRKAAEYVLASSSDKEASQFGEDLVATWREPRERNFEALEPGRSLVERWDYIELCCGPNTPLLDACLGEGMVCGPRIDILLHSVWDIRSGRLIEWMVYLVFSGRVYFIHCGAPCTTFSIARTPKERSKQFPLGKPGCSSKVEEGNMLLFRTLVVLYAVYLAGRDPRLRYTVGSHEHPGSAFSWHVQQVRQLFGHDGCGIVPLSYCQFGAPYRKHTKFGFIYAH